VNSLAGYGEIFFRNTQASGVIPQISVILGPCAGGAVYSPALTDFVFVVDKISKMFITGPEVIKTVLGEEISMEDLGGAAVHSEITGNAHFFATSENECFDQIKKLMSFIPWNNTKKADPFPIKKPKNKVFKLTEIFPTDSKKPYDVRLVIKAICDDSDFFEVHERFAANIVVGFARMNGQSVGFVANQPMVLAGVLDVDSSDKQARFIRFCDAFNIPIVLLVDTPGYLPGKGQEHAGIIRHGAKVLYALSEATVPKIAILLRKVYGGAALGMGIMPGFGTDLIFGWPTAEVGAMGAAQAVDLFYGDEIKKAQDPQEYRERKIQDYKDLYADPLALASDVTWVQDIIEPAETRRCLVRSLNLIENKGITRNARRHGNIPL